MKVVFTPISNGNPFQKELAGALERLGHTVDLYDPAWQFPLLKYIRKNGKPDVVHLHWLHPFLMKTTIQGTLLRANITLFEIVILRALGVKLVWTVHNVLDHERTHPILEKLYQRFIMRFFNEIIFFSRSSVSVFNEIIDPPPQIRKNYNIIPHGNYISSYINKIDIKIGKDILGIDANSFVLLCFGEIRPYKGINTMIEAFSKLTDKDYRLVVAGRPHNRPGDKSLSEEILSAIKPDKRIIPHLYFIPDYFVQIFMNAADIVILPYTDILNSGAAVLAMSFGKPVIAPNIGSIPELIDSNGGILFDPSKEGDLQRAIEQSKNLDLQAMGKYNFEKIKKYDWDSIAHETSEVYFNLTRVNSSKLASLFFT